MHSGRRRKQAAEAGSLRKMVEEMRAEIRRMREMLEKASIERPSE
jgi:hypothetical protein